MNNIFEFTIPMYLLTISLVIMAGGLKPLFATHQPMEKRSSRLESPATRTY